MTHEHLITRVADGVGHITLNRPEAINALSFAMIGALTEVFDAWRADSEVSLVVLDGAGDRGFCAGGDIRELRRQIVEGRGADAREFFRQEYRLDAMIAEFPKPVVSILDGVAMGGGLGIGGHASIRIVTERSRLAMPETRIGFTPDVGGAFLLSRAPGEIGTYMALNAATITGADAVALGFADFFVRSERITALIDALAERADPASPAEIVLLFDETPADSELLKEQAWIDEAYSAASVGEIMTRLRELAASGNDAHARAAAAADELDGFSPTALAVTLQAVRRAKTLPGLREVLQQDMHLVSWFLEHPDLPEGVRAHIVDKDRSPTWNPARLADVRIADVEQAFRQPAPQLWS